MTLPCICFALALTGCKGSGDTATVSDSEGAGDTHDTAAPPATTSPLVIAEIQAAPGAAEGEWVEILNTSDEQVDLSGLLISDGASDFELPGGVTLEGKGLLVLGASTDTSVNGGAPVDVAWGSALSLADEDGAIVLAEPGRLLDEVRWNDTFPATSDGAMCLKTPLSDAASNDSGSSWCTCDTTYGDGDAGSPGSENTCPTVVIGQDKGSATAELLTGLVAGQMVVIDEPTVFTGFGAWLADPGDSVALFGLYSGDSGPTVLLAASDETSLVAGENVVPALQELPLDAGSYFVMAIYDGTTGPVVQIDDAVYQSTWYLASEFELPSSLSGAYSYQDRTLSYYLTAY